MSWFKRQENEIESTPEKRVRTEGLWIKCEGCKQLLFKADLENNLQVCPRCNRHFRMDARSRLALLLEPGYELVDLELKSTDPLEFTDLKSYKSRLAKAQADTGLNDAIVNAIGKTWPAFGGGECDGVLLYWRKHGLRWSARRLPALWTAR